MSTFTHAGVSTLNGSIKARFANDQLRVKVLAKNGHKDIDIIELKHAMSKEDAVAFLISINFDNGNASVRAALEAEVEKRSDKPAKAPKAKAAPKTKKSTPSMDAIQAKVAAKKAAASQSTVSKAQVIAQLADMEDAPF